MSGDTTVTTVTTEAGVSVEKTWKLENWCLSYKMVVAAEASFHVEVGDPKVALRFFLRSKKEFVARTANRYPIVLKSYSLCAEVLTQLYENAVIRVTAIATGDREELARESGAIPLNKSKGKIIEVIDPFIYSDIRYMDRFGQLGGIVESDRGNGERWTNSVSDMNICITAQMFRFIDTGHNATPTAVDSEKSSSTEDSLTEDLKNLYVEHDNYADLKIESKDHMTLDAHKFLLAARSRYLRKCIDDTIKAENFNGTMKMNINGKPLVAILHWMYTGELHDNVGSVMEELVDAAVLFELTQLMKLLDKEIISICNKENMFRLYQVAQKNGMPNAMDDVSAYIREHL